MQLGGYGVFYGGDDGRGRNGILAVPYTINFQSALKNRPKYRTVFYFAELCFIFRHTHRHGKNAMPDSAYHMTAVSKSARNSLSVICMTMDLMNTKVAIIDRQA